jgi:hypothetical protein
VILLSWAFHWCAGRLHSSNIRRDAISWGGWPSGWPMAEE